MVVGGWMDACEDVRVDVYWWLIVWMGRVNGWGDRVGEWVG